MHVGGTDHPDREARVRDSSVDADGRRSRDPVGSDRQACTDLGGSPRPLEHRHLPPLLHESNRRSQTGNASADNDGVVPDRHGITGSHVPSS